MAFFIFLTGDIEQERHFSFITNIVTNFNINFNKSPASQMPGTKNKLMCQATNRKNLQRGPFDVLGFLETAILSRSLFAMTLFASAHTLNSSPLCRGPSLVVSTPQTNKDHGDDPAILRPQEIFILKQGFHQRRLKKREGLPFVSSGSGFYVPSMGLGLESSAPLLSQTKKQTCQDIQVLGLSITYRPNSQRSPALESTNPIKV